MNHILFQAEPRHAQPGCNKVELQFYTILSNYRGEAAAVVVNGDYIPASRSFKARKPKIKVLPTRTPTRRRQKRSRARRSKVGSMIWTWTKKPRQKLQRGFEVVRC